MLAIHFRSFFFQSPFSGIELTRLVFSDESQHWTKSKCNHFQKRHFSMKQMRVRARYKSRWFQCQFIKCSLWSAHFYTALYSIVFGIQLQYPMFAPHPPHFNSTTNSLWDNFHLLSQLKRSKCYINHLQFDFMPVRSNWFIVC